MIIIIIAQKPEENGNHFNKIPLWILQDINNFCVLILP